MGESCGKGVAAELCSPVFWRDCACEVLVTFLLVHFITMAGTKIGLGTSADIPLIHVALGSGFLVFMLIECFMHISGCHMNPAVTLMFILWRKCSLIRAFFYIICQLIGAIGGAALVYGLTPAVYRHQIPYFHIPDKEVSIAQAICCEAIFTAMLIWGIMGSGDAENRKPILPSLPPGLVIALDIMIGGKYTMAAMNPALAFGPAVVTGHWEEHYVYWIGPLLGATMGFLVYFSMVWVGTRFANSNKEEEKEDGAVMEKLRSKELDHHASVEQLEKMSLTADA